MDEINVVNDNSTSAEDSHGYSAFGMKPAGQSSKQKTHDRIQNRKPMAVSQHNSKKKKEERVICKRKVSTKETKKKEESSAREGFNQGDQAKHYLRSLQKCFPIRNCLLIIDLHAHQYFVSNKQKSRRQERDKGNDRPIIRQ